MTGSEEVQVSMPLPMAMTRRPVWRKLSRNRALWVGLAVVLIIILAGILSPWLSPYDSIATDYSNVLQPPSIHHWFGTDELGRDELARVLIGARTSMEVAGGSLIVGIVVGVPIGLFSGYYRGIADEWIVMRFIDALQAFPFLILALVLAAMLGPGAGNAMIAIGIGYIPLFARIVRGQVLAELEKEFIASARMVGANDWYIMSRHIFPNIMTPLIIQASMAMASGIVAEASLSYLGLGVQPPVASWGSMLKDAQGFLGQAPGMVVFPGIALAVAVLGFNLLGDGLQIWLDPRQRR